MVDLSDETLLGDVVEFVKGGCAKSDVGYSISVSLLLALLQRRGLFLSVEVGVQFVVVLVRGVSLHEQPLEGDESAELFCPLEGQGEVNVEVGQLQQRLGHFLRPSVRVQDYWVEVILQAELRLF